MPDVVAAVGDRAEVFVDTGVTTGADIIAARALGARATLVGRAYLYGLMAGGQAGVARALEILAAEALRTMQLLGVERVRDGRPCAELFDDRRLGRSPGHPGHLVAALDELRHELLAQCSRCSCDEDPHDPPPLLARTPQTR